MSEQDILKGGIPKDRILVLGPGTLSIQDRLRELGTVENMEIEIVSTVEEIRQKAGEQVEQDMRIMAVRSFETVLEQEYLKIAIDTRRKDRPYFRQKERW